MSILIALTIVGRFDGITSLVNVCQEVALKLLNSLSFNGSVWTKPLWMVIIEMMTFIKRAIAIIAFVLAPTQMMIIGPSATFGREFNMVKKGSRTSATNGFMYMMVLIKKAKAIPSEKEITISKRVTPMCMNSSPLWTRLKRVKRTREGLENMKLFMKPKRAPISQIAKKEATNRD